MNLHVGNIVGIPTARKVCFLTALGTYLNNPLLFFAKYPQLNALAVSPSVRKKLPTAVVP
jgi:hypothetical protein